MVLITTAVSVLQALLAISVALLLPSSSAETGQPLLVDCDPGPQQSEGGTVFGSVTLLAYYSCFVPLYPIGKILPSAPRLVTLVAYVVVVPQHSD